MVTFLRLAQSDPNIAKVPFMVDSSQWSTLEATLKEIQGREHCQFNQSQRGRRTFYQKGQIY